MIATLDSSSGAVDDYFWHETLRESRSTVVAYCRLRPLVERFQHILLTCIFRVLREHHNSKLVQRLCRYVSFSRRLLPYFSGCF